MQTQISARFLAVNHEIIRRRLSEIKAILTGPMFLMRGAIIDYSESTQGGEQPRWVQIRDEGKMTRLVYKEVTEQRTGGMKGLEITLSSFDDALAIFKKMGIEPLSIQESRRELWQVGTVDVRLDEWPWVKPLVEIEGPSEAAVRDVSARLGLPWSQAVFGNITFVYAAEYPGIRLDKAESIVQIPEVRFGEPLPDWLKERAKG